MKIETTSVETKKYIAKDGTEFDSVEKCCRYETEQDYKSVTQDPECGYLPDLYGAWPMDMYCGDDRDYLWFRPTTFRGSLKLYLLCDGITCKSMDMAIETIDGWADKTVCIENNCGDYYYHIIENGMEDLRGTLEKLGYKIVKENNNNAV